METNCTLCWEKATQRMRKTKRGRVFCIRIILRLLFPLNRSLSLLVGNEVGKLNIDHTFILETWQVPPAHHFGDLV